MAKIYVNSAELEEYWYGWLLTKDNENWVKMSDMIYKICEGVATKFNPRSEDEHCEHIHDAWIQVMDKIKNNKLRYIHGRAPVFNLITTTIYRILYSKMNKQKKQKEHQDKYIFNTLQIMHPELLSHNIQQTSYLNE